MTDSKLTLTRPDDWHLHLRDGAVLASVVPHVARRFARAIVMPNLTPPVTTVAEARAYRERILTAVPPGLEFAPLMTLYLTDHTDPDEIARAKASGVVQGVKHYPAGATTNAGSGVADLKRARPVLSAMEQHDLPLLVHGEVTDAGVDVFDRERVFIDQHLVPLLADFPRLRVVLEHITTREAAEFVERGPPMLAATITAHHLLLNRNAMFSGGFRPHHYCLPVLKREAHRLALVRAATGGNPRFFLGTDSAPHARGTKEAACGCAGIYSSHAALELYAEVFDNAGALSRLEAFASFNGPDFYRLSRNQSTVTLERRDWTVPPEYPFGRETLVPLRAGETVHWALAS